MSNNVEALTVWHPIETAPEGKAVILARKSGYGIWSAWTGIGRSYDHLSDKIFVHEEASHWFPLPAWPTPESVEPETDLCAS